MGLGSALWRWLSTKAWFDWLCLFLIINPYFLCYYGYDSIGSIMEETEKLFHTDKAGIGLLYSMHSIPVIATVFFIGIVIDKFGTQKTAMVLAVCTLLGSICVATGHRHFGVLILGRLLFGFGSESMSVTAQKMLAHKFKDSILSLAFGFQIFWGQLGSCVVFVLMPILNDHFGTIGALWSVPIYAIFSVLTTGAYYWIDTKAEADSRARHSPPVSPNTSFLDESGPSDHDPNSVSYSTSSSSLLQHAPPRPRDAKNIEGRSSSPSISSSGEFDDSTIDGDYASDTKALIAGRIRRNRANSERPSLSPVNDSSSPHTDLHMIPSEAFLAPTSSSPPSDRFEFKDLLTFPIAFWVLLVLYFSVSTTFFVWNSFGGDRLNEKYGIQPKQAGMVVALSNLAAMASPLTGFFVDRVGHRTKFILSGVILMLLTYCAITWTNLLPTLWYVLLGLGVSLCQPIVFASVSLVVKETITGTAFALMSLALNIGQVAMPAIVGAMHRKTHSYQTSNYVFVGLAVLALLFAFILFIIERKMRILDTIGLWRGTAPPSVYSDLLFNAENPPAAAANPYDLYQNSHNGEPSTPGTNIARPTPTFEPFLPPSYDPETHIGLDVDVALELSDDEAAAQPLNQRSSPISYSSSASPSI